MTDTATQIFHALSDPTRRRLLEVIMRTEDVSVATLTAGSGVTQPAVSKHLAVLKAAGLVTSAVAGRQNLYRIRPGAFAPLVDWMAEYRAFWDNRLDRLEDTLDRMDR